MIISQILGIYFREKLRKLSFIYHNFEKFLSADWASFFCEKLELSRIVKFRDNFAADNDLKAASIIKNLSPAKPGTLNKIIYHLACQIRPK